jgi:hypothetical protein
MTSPLIRTLSAPEVETLVSWAAAEGWNPGVGDVAPFYAADPEGFLGAFVDGEMAAGISAVAYGETFGFIGLYIAEPAFRGRGLGRTVWDAGMARLARRTVGLDGVLEQQANYTAMGFVKAYETVRMSGAPPAARNATVAVAPGMLPAIMALDRECFPEARDSFLTAWLAPPRRALAVIDDGALAGYGVVRPSVDGGAKIGPLYARSTTAALSLLAALTASTGGPIQIDVPLAQTPFLKALTEAGMTPGFATARMYRGTPPAIRQSQVFGISTLELG